VRPPPVPVAEVVRQPESSPDSPLVRPPAAASAGVGLGLGGNDTLSEDDDDDARSPSCNVGNKMTGLDSGSQRVLFDYGEDDCADPVDDSPTDGEVSSSSV
jgi:hypothetical protein